MADTNQLNIKIQVDGRDLNSGMGQASATVESAAARMAASLKTAGLSAAEAASALKNLGFSATETAAALGETAVASESVARSANNARSAFMGLNSELGLRGNRALGTFISQSQTLGPILNTAFSGIAILGFIQLATMAAQKISTLISDTFLFTDAEKQLYASLVASNAEMGKADEQHKKALRELQLIGLDGLATDQKKLQFSKEDRAAAQARVASLGKEVELETQKLNKLQQQQAETDKITANALGGKGGRAGVNPAALEAQARALDAQQQAVTSLNNQLGLLQAQLRAAGDEATNFGKKLSVDTLKEFEKETQKAAAEAKAAAELAQRNFEKSMEQRGVEYKEELDAEHKYLIENLDFDKEADKEIEKSKKDLAETQIRLMREVTAENNRQVRQQEALTKQLLEPWQKLASGIQQSMRETTMGLVDGTMTVQRAFTKLGEGILSAIVNSLAKVLAQHITHALMVNVVEQSQLATSIANFLGYMTTKQAAAKAAAEVQGTTDAGLAGAAAFASVIEALPFPANIAVAPGVAAGAIADTMALVSFAVGTNFVPHDMIAQVHRGEIIVPAGPAEQFREGTLGGGHQIHYHISAIDGNSVREMLMKEGDMISAVIRRQHRENRR